MATSEPRHLQAFAVLRIDKGSSFTDSGLTFERDGKSIPAAGPGGVTVKEVLMTAEAAQNEVVRLNALNGDKDCVYYWQSTHLFINGGSHGDAKAK
jgi:hypothetical protein